MSFDYRKLLGRMKEKEVTQESLAHSIGLRAETLSKKLNNKGKFKQTEILDICKMLGIHESEIVKYFFTQ